MKRSSFDGPGEDGCNKGCIIDKNTWNDQTVIEKQFVTKSLYKI